MIIVVVDGSDGTQQPEGIRLINMGLIKATGMVFFVTMTTSNNYCRCPGDGTNGLVTSPFVTPLTTLSSTKVSSSWLMC